MSADNTNDILLKGKIKAKINDGHLEEAKTLLIEYKEAVSEDIEIYSIEAVISIMENKVDEAEKILLSGLSIDNNNFDLNYNLGYIYENEEKYRPALQHYKKAFCSCEDNDLKKSIGENIKKLIELCSKSLQVKGSRGSSINKVLFVQSVPDIRTNKIAKILHDRNIQVDIMYFEMHPKEVYKGMELPYTNIIQFGDFNSTIGFINNSDYDILISCNEPDYFSALLEMANKPIVHDCHDMMSLRGNLSNEQIVAEYLANSNSDGNIYVTPLVRKIAEQKFNLGNKPIMILDNYVLKDQLPKKFLNKLSNTDGQIHCVYEGGLTNAAGHHRNIENIFTELARNKIHVHFYASFKNDYYQKFAGTSGYLHCEETKEPTELIEDMTKYDVGLTVLNVTDRNKTFLDTTFPNKAWEYLAAGLPILFSDLISFREFLNIRHVGEIIDIKKDLMAQVQRVCNIEIQSNYLSMNKLCMDDFADEVIRFLEKVKDRKPSK